MSHGARAEASEIFLHTESRRPNPHKSVPLAGQERPFPRARESSRVVLGWEVGRPFVRPLESRNRDSFIKSFNADDARPRGRSIIVVIEGVTLSMLDIETRYRHREKIAASIYGNVRNINETHWIANMQSFLSSLREKPLLDRRKERNTYSSRDNAKNNNFLSSNRRIVLEQVLKVLEKFLIDRS